MNDSSNVLSKKVQMHLSICEKLNQIYEAKNHDYGDSFSAARKEIPFYTLGKLYDKFSRYKNIVKVGQNRVIDETIKDTLYDMANYCIMELLEMQNEEETNNGKKDES